MQIKSLRLVSYRSWKIDDREYSTVAKVRYHKLEVYQQLRAEGCTEATALSASGLSRASVYRYQHAYKKQGLAGLKPKPRTPKKKRQPGWTKQLEQHVLSLRKRYPLWGKAKLTEILKRDYQQHVSESTVGRILTKLKKQQKIQPVCFYYGRAQAKRARSFHGHAKRWNKQLKAQQPGEMIQIDHMKVYPQPGHCYVHFKATCPLTKLTIAQAYHRATSANAAHFLTYLQQQFPFKILSIQVDGGSEFRAEFEKACEQPHIALFVLPPRSPEKNGQVERGNCTFKYEFYYTYQGICALPDIRRELKNHTHFYNTLRPHQSLKQQTPMAYFQQHFQEANLSQM